MEIVCFDMEGTLTPEIWERVALRTGIDEFNKTTRDIPDYSELMDFRLDVMRSNNLKLSDIQEASSELELLPGAYNFLQKIRQNFQVVILSDTFHEIAKPLMEKMGFPLLLCHNLDVVNDEIISYKLRNKKAKKQAIESFQSIGYRCLAAGDSYNDIGMLQEADLGVLFSAPSALIKKYRNFKVAKNYTQLKQLLTK